MSTTEATAEIFVTAFKALKPKAREAVWLKLVTDSKLGEDLRIRSHWKLVGGSQENPSAECSRR